MTFKAGDRVVLNAAAAAVAKHLGGLRGMVVDVGPIWGDLTEYTVELDELPASLLAVIKGKRIPIVGTYLDPEPLEFVGVGPARPEPAACSFCGEPNACAVHVSGLRCQAEPWHYCARVGCCESIDLHVSRLEAGLVDCSETRAATRAWYLAKVEREKKERRA